MVTTLNPDTQVLLLLCGELGRSGGNEVKPLTAAQYHSFDLWLQRHGWHPAELLNREVRATLAEVDGSQLHAQLSSARIEALLDRGGALAFAVERWESAGLWVMSRYDPDYPQRFRTYLGAAAPPLLYGVGARELLNRGGLAVVGSRDRSEEDGAFAQRVGEQCAREKIVVISGAAKGIDRDAMGGAIESGGYAAGILAEGLSRAAVSGQFRSDLTEERLVLLSPYDPDSRWFAYTAMDRNKLLYAASDAALVVASSDEKGGTWAGAAEALRAAQVRVYVKATGQLAPGNSRLLRMGALPFPEPCDDIRALLVPPASRAPETPLFPGF